MRKLLLFPLALLLATVSYSQDFSNKGKDFWVSYGYHERMGQATPPGGTQDMVLYFASDSATTVTVSCASTGFTATYSVPANTVYATPAIPKFTPQDHRLTTEGLSDKGLHIVSTKPIVAYAHIYNGSVSGATILYPTNTLGKEYYSVNYKNNSNLPNANGWFYVIAVDTGTTVVEITPSANTSGGWNANTTYTVNLTQGQVYNVMGSLINNATAPYTAVDLTGSLIKSVASNNGSCKRIAVFSGSGRIHINCSGNNNSSSDNYMVQALPKSAWGKTYLTVPTANYGNGVSAGSPASNIFRVCVTDPATVVNIDGVIGGYPLQNNFYYEIPASANTHSVTADKPIMVAQYLPSQGGITGPNSTGCIGTGGGDGDPEVIYLSPVEQKINKVRWNACRNSAINAGKHYINILIPNGGTAISSFKLDGVTVAASNFITHPNNSSYSYARINVSGSNTPPGIPHVVESDSGFNAIAYGYGGAESYGYNAGTNIRDLNQQLEVQSQYGIESSPNVCTNSPFIFKVYFPDSAIVNAGPLAGTYQLLRFDSMIWNITPVAGISPNNFPVVVNGTVGTPPKVAVDSITIKNGRQVAWYSLPTNYTISTPGIYTITISTYKASGGDCGGSNEDEFEFTLEASAPPVADFTYTNNGCFTDTVRFFDATITSKPTYLWNWNFGDGFTSTVKNPVHKYASPGTYTVTYSNITTPGCISNTITKDVIVTAEPVANFTMSSPICAGLPVTFTDGSAASGNGVLNKWYWAYGDGAVDTVIAPGSPNRVHTYAPWNPSRTATLKVVTQTGCTSPVSAQTFKVHPIPVSDFTMPAGICLPSGNATFTATSTIADGTGGMIYNWTFNDPNANAGNPNTATGSPASHFFDGTNIPYNILLRTTSAAGCFHDSIKVFDKVFIQEHASATTTILSGCVGTSTVFTDNSVMTGPGVSIISCHWDFGDGSTGTGCVTSHTYAVPGNYNVLHWVVTNKGCNSDTVPLTVTINPIPTAGIAGTTAVCQNAAPPPVTFTGSGAAPGAIYTFYYHINAGPAQNSISNAAGTAVLNAPTTTAGVFTYTLDSVLVAATGCVQVLSPAPTAVITVNPLPAATISGTTAVCNGYPSPYISFTGSNGTAPYTFTYNINGGGNLTVVSNAAGIATVAAPTGVTGPFTYTLTGVQDASVTTCQTTGLNQQAVVTVNPLPTATISGTTTVCLNAPMPFITFNGSGSTPPYTYYYHINGGGALNNSTGSVPAPTNVAGVFVYTLDSVKDASATTCVKILSPAPTATVTVEALPLAPTAGSNSPVCEGNTINLTASAVAGALPNGYNWSGPGAFTSNNQNPSLANATLAMAGNYTVTVTTGPTGCTSLPSAPVNVVVNITPVISNVTKTDPTTCSGSDGTITLNGLTPGNSYTVTYDKNGIAQAALNLVANGAGAVVITGLTSGTYSNIIITLGNCPSAVAPTQQLNDPNPPAAPTANSNSPICAGATLNLTASSSAVGTQFYNWTGPNGFTSTSPTPSITNATVAATGNYSVTVTVNNCVSAATIIPVVVNPLPTASFTTSTPVCETRTVTFTSTSAPNVGTITGYSWNYGDASPVITNPSPVTHIYAAAGVYPATLTVTNSAGCVSAPANVPVTVHETPLAGYIIPEVCLADTYAQFTDTSKVAAPSGIASWHWKFNDPNSSLPINPDTSILQNPQHSFTAIGLYNVELIVTTNQGCTDAIIQQLQVNGSYPNSIFTVLNPAALCSNDSVAIVNNSNVFPGNITKVEIWWNNAGLLPGTPPDDVDQNPTPGKVYKHKYPTFQAPLTRPFQVKFRAYSGGICQDDSLYTITVHAAPKVQFTAVPPVCLDAAPFSLTPTYASEIGGVPGTGTFTGPGVNAAGVFNPAGVGPGTYNIKYTFSSTAAGCTDTISRNITVLEPAVADFTVSNVKCEKVPVTFDAASSIIPAASGTIASYRWNFGDGSPVQTVSTPTINHTFANWNAVPFNVTLQVITSNGCVSAVKTIPVTISSTPVPAFTIPASLCIPNANASFPNTSSNPDGSAMTYLWNYGELSSGALNTGTSFTGNHWYSSTGPFNVTLTATSSGQCFKDSMIVLNTIHPQPKADFTISKPSGICVGDNVIFTDASTNGGGIKTAWFWELGDGTTQNIPSFNHTYTTNKEPYAVTLYIQNSFGCNSDTITKPFNVYPFPTVNAGPDKFVLEGGQVKPEPTATGNDLQYLWTPNLYLAGNSNTILVPTVNGVQDITYRLTVTARGGCSKFDDVFVKVLKFPVIPNTFTPNNDGINDFWTISYLSTYPDNRVQVFTRDGQMVFESKGYGKPWDGTKNGKTLPMDTYYYIIEPGSGRAPITGYVTIVK